LEHHQRGRWWWTSGASTRPGAGRARRGGGVRSGSRGAAVLPGRAGGPSCEGTAPCAAREPQGQQARDGCARVGRARAHKTTGAARRVGRKRGHRAAKEVAARAGAQKAQTSRSAAKASPRAATWASVARRGAGLRAGREPVLWRAGAEGPGRERRRARRQARERSERPFAEASLGEPKQPWPHTGRCHPREEAPPGMIGGCEGGPVQWSALRWGLAYPARQGEAPSAWVAVSPGAARASG
jgi:hypothetical protein